MANASGFFTPSVPSLGRRIQPPGGLCRSGFRSPEGLFNRVFCSSTSQGGEKLSAGASPSESRVPRHYLLDLMRVTPRDANYTGPGSRFCILRPELITAFCQAQAAEKSKCKSEGDAHVITDSSNVPGVDKQVRLVANASTSCDCHVVFL
ncbi:Clustered mitochondria protein [Morella rubra]|uniref:Clustered mitochondria protein n=1 Tax=Morella rubra TaxID=262757 RepID=A0A6A1UFE2_9ROSI|nr:Clustered mitochondria protein [Morella rubra]KAB1199079.1 Clustered mitochondria protein [Morella rubra]